MIIENQCLFCKHYDTSRDLEGARKRLGYCSVFPKGIPRGIYYNRFDHSRPYPGDNGVRFEPRGPASREIQRRMFVNQNDEGADDYEEYELEAEKRERAEFEEQRMRDEEDVTASNVFPLVSPVRLMHTDNLALYAIGWSFDDLLLDLISSDDVVIAKHITARIFSASFRPIYNMIDPDIYNDLFTHRPEFVKLRPDHPGLLGGE